MKIKMTVVGALTLYACAILALGVLSLGLSSCSLRALTDFSVLSVSIAENGVIGTGRQEIEIVFSKEVREEGAREKIKVETDTGAEISLQHRVSRDRVTLTPEADWSPHERYWLVIAKDLKDIYGKEIGEEFCLPFQSTEELIPVSAALLVPELHNGVVTAETDLLRMVFSAGVNRSSVERAFSLTPSIEGSFDWDSDRSFSYRFRSRLRKNSLYSVSISNSARDQHGYSIKAFSSSFEYFPNRSCPAVERMAAGGGDFFDRTDPSTFSLQDGKYVIDCPSAEKDIALVVSFSASSAPIDRSSFDGCFQVSPHVVWREEWLDDFTVKIAFEEELDLGGEYEVRLTRGIKDEDGLSALYEYLIELTVNGDGSSFLELTAEGIVELDVGAKLWIPNGSNPPNIVEVEKSVIVKGTDVYGPYIRIPYTGTAAPEEFGVELIIDLRFACSGSSALPVVDGMSLQDSVGFRTVFGDNCHQGGIQSYEWTEGVQNGCTVHIVDAGSENIYLFSIGGGRNGVVDDQGNYMESDVELYFKLILFKLQ